MGSHPQHNIDDIFPPSDTNDGEPDSKLKVLLIGDPAVGKTALISRIFNDGFSEDYKPTDLHTYTSQQTITVEENQINVIMTELLQLEDRAKHYRGIHVYFIIFAFNSEKSFQSVRKYVEETRKFAFQDSIILLIGNKSDLEKSITTEQAEFLAKSLKVGFHEVCCKNNTGIDVVWEEVTRGYLNIANKFPM